MTWAMVLGDIIWPVGAILLTVVVVGFWERFMEWLDGRG